METNEGVLDRTIRIALGLALIGVALGIYGPAYTSMWGWVGVIPLLTGLVGYCPAYSLCGIRTCQKT